MGPEDGVLTLADLTNIAKLLKLMSTGQAIPPAVPASSRQVVTPSPAPPAIERVKVQILPDGRMDPKNAALYLGRKEKTLAQWRSRGVGPKWLKNSGRIFYFQSDLDDFIAKNKTQQIVRHIGRTDDDC